MKTKYIVFHLSDRKYLKYSNKNGEEIGCCKNGLVGIISVI